MQRVAQGRCARCNQAPLATTRFCQQCRERCNARCNALVQANYHSRKARGVCVRCEGVPLVTEVLCAVCRDKGRIPPELHKVRKPANPFAQRERRANRIAEGKCVDCQGSPLVTKELCATCREKHNASSRQVMQNTRNARIARGVCVRCETPVLSGKRECPTCLTKKNACEQMRALKRKVVIIVPA
jgi:hypothetical protein